LLREFGAARPDAVRSRHWIVGVDSIGRATLPAVVESVQARLAPRVSAVRARLDAVEAERHQLLTEESG
jgi:hypothetical protein